jgi:nucleoside-diphosphate-sugar epimerase
VRKNSNVGELKQLGVELAHGDILAGASLDGNVEGIDIVYHLAAMGHVSAVSKQAFELFRKVNVEGTRNLVKACSRHRISKFIHVSSTAAMGLIKAPIVDETTECRPATPYQKSKRESEQVVLEYWKKEGFPAVIVRPCMVYGPGGKG